MLHALSWVVHPLAGLTLAFLASVIFSRQRRQWKGVLGAVLLMVLLSRIGAGWVVHPAAGLTIALLSSLGFHAWRREWPTLLAGLIALMVFAVLGASWAIFPLLALGMAWLAKVVFSGELLRLVNGTPSVRQEDSAQAIGQPSRAALPQQGSGMALSMDTLGALPRERERGEVRLQKRLAKLERRAQRLGVSLTKEATPPAPPAVVPVRPAPAAPPSPPSGLLALSRDERLPAEARARLGALHFRTSEALAYLKEREQDGAGSGFLLRQIVEDYAPEAVQAYLKLPPSLAGVTVLQGGKTGRELLSEQLDLLLDAVRDMLEGAAQAGSQHLLAHQRFLRERFARPPDDLKL
ncbi:hypothetical protein [Deinococcus ruber]|uniref:hypothetical protein n=1 Tax=Deinococcus ruber TaxID=1848197 RepID=UPI001E3B6C44|nr:hypothetical protein [Deinococcus ruber]